MFNFSEEVRSSEELNSSDGFLKINDNVLANSANHFGSKIAGENISASLLNYGAANISVAKVASMVQSMTNEIVNNVSNPEMSSISLYCESYNRNMWVFFLLFKKKLKKK